MSDGRPRGVSWGTWAFGLATAAFLVAGAALMNFTLIGLASFLLLPLALAMGSAFGRGLVRDLAVDPASIAPGGILLAAGLGCAVLGACAIPFVLDPAPARREMKIPASGAKIAWSLFSSRPDRSLPLGLLWMSAAAFVFKGVRRLGGTEPKSLMVVSLGAGALGPAVLALFLYLLKSGFPTTA